MKKGRITQFLVLNLVTLISFEICTCRFVRMREDKSENGKLKHMSYNTEFLRTLYFCHLVVIMPDLAGSSKYSCSLMG